MILACNDIKSYVPRAESYFSLFTHVGFESWKASDIYWYWFVDIVILFSSFILKDIGNEITHEYLFFYLDMLPALEERDQKIVNNPIEAHIIAEVCYL